MIPKSQFRNHNSDEAQPRRIDGDPLNLQEVIARFMRRAESDRIQAKTRWLPLYQAILNELDEFNYGFTLDELHAALEFMLVGNNIFIRVINNGPLRYELFCYHTYILEQINKVTKFKINKLIFC